MYREEGSVLGFDRHGAGGGAMCGIITWKLEIGDRILDYCKFHMVDVVYGVSEGIVKRNL